MTEIVACKLVKPEELDALMPSVLPMLTSEMQEKLSRIRQDKVKQRTLIGHLLTLYLLHNRTGTLPSHPAETGQNGKPFPNGFQGTFINISHSGKWVVAAISPREVGVDIEKMRPVRPGLAERFFSAPEIEWLNEAESDEERQHRFFLLWTMKEAFLKAVGKGLTQSLRSFTVKPERNGFYLEGDEQAEGFILNELAFRPRYRLAVCHRTGSVEPDITRIKLARLIKKLAKKR